MSDINPFETPPVYKYDQVVTERDLVKLRKYYFSCEKAFFLNQQIEESVRACYAHAVIEEIVKWLEEGKPDLKEEEWE